MKGLGSGENGEFTFLDLISIISFVVGMQNLDMNITQEDMAQTAEKLDMGLHNSVEDIHRHLAVQDEKLNIILKILKENGGVINDQN